MLRRFLKKGLKVSHLPQALYIRTVRNESLSNDSTEQKSRAHIEVMNRFTQTFSYEQLFVDVNWQTIPPDKRDFHAKCLIGRTMLIIGQSYIGTRTPIMAGLAFEMGHKVLSECARMDPADKQLPKLVEKCRQAREYARELAYT